MAAQKEDFVANLLKEEISLSVNRGFASKNSVIKSQTQKIGELESQIKASEIYFSNFVKQLNFCLDKPYYDPLSLKRAIRNVIQASSNRAKSVSSNSLSSQIYSNPTVTITVAKNKSQFISDKEVTNSDTPYENSSSDKQNLGKFVQKSNEPIPLSQILLEKFNVKSVEDSGRKTTEVPEEKTSKQIVNLTYDSSAENAPLAQGLRRRKRVIKRAANKSQPKSMLTGNPDSEDESKFDTTSEAAELSLRLKTNFS